MLMIEKPNRAWGIAYRESTITGSLFTSEVFTFRYQANQYIERAGKTVAAHGLYPVLVDIVVTIASAEDAEAYHTEQEVWRADRKRTREVGQ